MDAKNELLVGWLMVEFNGKENKNYNEKEVLVVSGCVCVYINENF